MLEEKRKDLDSEKQKRLLRKLVEDLSRTEPDLYYRPTSEIALFLTKYIDGDSGLLAEEKSLLKRLSQRDIEVLLSLH
ncbi:MAG: hypothetical protein AB3N07_04890 [Ruegeria sp.]